MKAQFRSTATVMAKSFRDKIDDYKDTVFAIIGFGNLFRFNNKTKTMDNSIKLAQGRKFKTTALNRISPNNSVTPDLCIQLNSESAIIAEVKISFPKNQEHWIDDFNQLVSYDDNLANWWTSDLTIKNHSIVLLPHQTRSVMVNEYFAQKNAEGQVKFERPFSIVEFNRSDQNNEHYFFRKISGDIHASEEIDKALKYGIPVPTEKLMLHYEKHKLYDSKPPMPYLLYIIWENVILRSVTDSHDLSGVRKNSKIEVLTSVDDITKELYENCSFKGFNFDESEHQPKTPITSWVRNAIASLTAFKYAEWINKEEGTCKIYFKRLDDVFESFIQLCSDHGIDTEDIEGSAFQIDLFKDEKSPS